MRSHDSNGCCPRVSDCPGLPPGSPWMSGGLARLFGAVRLLSARKHAAFKKGVGLGPQNCIWDSFTRINPTAGAGLGADPAPCCPRSSAPSSRWSGNDWWSWEGSSRQKLFSLRAAAKKKHSLIPPASQHLTEYVQLNVLVDMLRTVLHKVYSIYKWRKIILRWQFIPLKSSTALLLFD